MNARFVVALLAASAVAVSAVAATVRVDAYAYAWPLSTTAEGAAWQIELTPEVYAAITRADLGDVEVVNADGESVPSDLLQLTTSTADTARPLPLFVLPARSSSNDAASDAISLHVERDAHGKLRRIDAQVAGPRQPIDAAIDAVHERALLADASGSDDPLATLLIEWDRADGDVNAQFAIDASDDLQRWRTVVANAAVLRLAQDDHVLERHDVALGGVRATYLRIRRLDDGPALHGLRVFVRPRIVSTPVQRAPAWIDAIADGAEALPSDRKGQGTAVVYRYHLPAPLVIDAVRVRLVEDNALSTLTVLTHAIDPHAAWMQQDSIVAFRLRNGDGYLENGDSAVATGLRVRDLRLETANPPARPPTLTVAYRPDRIVFLARGPGPFRLIAGSTTQVRRAYAMSSALGSLRAQSGREWQPPLAALGPRQDLQGARALVASPAETSRDWRTWLLWAVLVAAAAVIAGLALRLLRSRPADE